MIFEAINKGFRLYEEFSLTVSENKQIGFNELFQQGKVNLVMQDFCFSLFFINSECLSEREDSLYLIPKEKEALFIKEYNFRVGSLVNEFTALYNDYNALSWFGVTPDFVKKLLLSPLRENIIKELINQKEKILNDIISNNEMITERAVEFFNERTELLKLIYKTIAEIKEDFQIEERADNLTAAQRILIFKFKYDAGLIPYKTKKDIVEEFGASSQEVKKYYQYMAGGNIQDPTEHDLFKIIPHLKDFEAAEKLAYAQWSKFQ